MKTQSYIRSIACLFAIAAFTPMKADAQEFPTYWSTSSYDYTKGEKGYLHVINFTPTHDNKAYIFATNIQGESGPHDLLRLTCNGVSTFNSPYANSEVKVNFYSHKNYQGEISASGGNMRIIGHNRLALGTQDNYSLIRITPQNITFSPNLVVDNSSILMRFGASDNGEYGWIGSELEDDVILGTHKKDMIVIDGSNRSISVGLSRAEFRALNSALKEQYGMFVKKGILCEDYSIAPVASWTDFVFDADYTLRPLNDVEHFISQNNHLPDVPSAQEIAEKGYSQHEMNKVLLQKIEELTLYTIQQQKEIAELKAQLAK